MAKGFKHGAGGSPLNFKVVAYATEEELKAATAKDNTIGVVTDKEITSWIFSANKPDEPTEGVLWIKVGDSSGVEFSVIKKTDIYTYPQFAYQFINGAWVGLVAYTYQNGEWIQWWDGTIYTIGNSYEAYTGGWGKVAPNSVIEGTFTMTDEGMTVTASSSSGRHCWRTHEKEIDLTDFDAIEVLAVGSSSRSSLGLVTADGMQNASVTFDSTSLKEYRLDISSITGKWHVFFGVCFFENGTFSATVRKIKLIKRGVNE